MELDARKYKYFDYGHSKDVNRLYYWVANCLNLPSLEANLDREFNLLLSL